MRRVQSCVAVPEDILADSVMAPDLSRVKSASSSSDCSSDSDAKVCASLPLACPKSCTVGVYEDWGGCPFMEDAHLIHAAERDALFCVYDGHGGSAAADHCRDHLHLRILSSLGCGATPAEALVDGFARTEDELLAEQRQQSTGSPCPAPELCGTTAVVALLREGSVHLAWLGDCRAVLCRGGEAIDLTRDHVLSGTAGSSERARVLAEVAPRSNPPSNPTSSPGPSPGPSPKLKPEPHPRHRAARSRAVDYLASWRWRGRSAIWTLRPAASRWG